MSDVDKSLSNHNDTSLESNDNAVMVLSELINLRKSDIYELDRLIKYQSFYFCGGRPTLLQCPFDDALSMMYYDPRWFDDYISTASLNAYHRHFLRIINNTIESCSFADASIVLTQCLDPKNGRIVDARKNDQSNVISILAGLKFFNKVEVFNDESNILSSRTNNVIDKALLTYHDLVNSEVQRLCNKFNVGNLELFHQENPGIMYKDRPFASKELVQRYQASQKQLEEFRREIISILQSVPNLNLGINSVQFGDVVNNGGTIDIDQAITFINNEVNKKDDRDVSNGSPNDNHTEPSNDQTDDVTNDAHNDEIDEIVNHKTPIVMSDRYNHSKIIVILIVTITLIVLFFMTIIVVILLYTHHDKTISGDESVR